MEQTENVEDSTLEDPEEEIIKCYPIIWEMH